MSVPQTMKLSNDLAIVAFVEREKGAAQHGAHMDRALDTFRDAILEVEKIIQVIRSGIPEKLVKGLELEVGIVGKGKVGWGVVLEGEAALKIKITLV